MEITKKKDGYYTGGKRFQTYSDAIGHAKRMAIREYLFIVSKTLKKAKGPVDSKQMAFLRGLQDALEEIAEERPYLFYEGIRGREQSPMKDETEMLLRRDKRDGELARFAA